MSPGAGVRSTDPRAHRTARLGQARFYLAEGTSGRLPGARTPRIVEVR